MPVASSENEEGPEGKPCIQCHCPGVVPACSSFAIQYNYVCASIAVAVMTSHRDETGTGVEADYPEPHWVETAMLSNVFIGSVVGMLVMGYLGDLIGVPAALIATNALSVGGAALSALGAWGSADTVWTVIAVGRLMLGVGVGGNYPLSAAKATQATPSADQAVAKAAGAFFWQIPGSCAPYLVLMLLLKLPHTADITSYQFRILLGLGALPALVVLVASCREVCAHMDADAKTAPRSSSKEDLAGEMADGGHWWTLVGTGGVWFFFDIAIYGIVVFQPAILRHIFGDSQSLMDLAWQGFAIQSLGIVGTAVGLALLDRVGAKLLAVAGLLAAAIFFVAFMAVSIWRPGYHNTLFSLLCSLFFVLYAGPNIATYVLPVFAFPADVRSTFHGLSAACAKVGAMAGTLIFPAIDGAYGVGAVMATQAGVCLLGALVGQCFIKDGGGARIANDSAGFTRCCQVSDASTTDTDGSDGSDKASESERQPLSV